MGCVSGSAYAWTLLVFVLCYLTTIYIFALYIRISCDISTALCVWLAFFTWARVPRLQLTIACRVYFGKWQLLSLSYCALAKLASWRLRQARPAVSRIWLAKTFIGSYKDRGESDLYAVCPFFLSLSCGSRQIRVLKWKNLLWYFQGFNSTGELQSSHIISIYRTHNPHWFKLFPKQGFLA